VEAPLRLDELGSVQFAQLCRAIVGTDGADDSKPWGFARVDGATLVLAVWVRNGGRLPRAGRRLQRIVREAVASAPATPRSVRVLTNVAARPELDGPRVEVTGPDELWALVRGQPSLRYRLPFLLGVSDLSQLLPDEPRRRSTSDVAEAASLARVFVPTRAYAQAVAVLEQHRFVVLSGPPEMGKTAVARMLGLAALSDGWEIHECVRPDELWERFDPERRQLFVADDAFGSTEYRPETAERWALELDRVLRTLDDRHRLVWTSRPTPLHAALRRIHREHGVERFPRPAQVGVDATELDVGEKALMLFRHAKALPASGAQVALVRRHGWEIVSHPHFTPERIRRFCSTRLAELAAAGAGRDVGAAVAAEIREPTAAMAASYHALADEHKAVLHALVDSPPGPVAEHDLAPALRRHTRDGLARPLAQTVDRLTDHFVRITGSDTVSWVHPSWRDLVIDELAGDPHARERFLHCCGVHGVALALSTAGGSGGERALPLLQEDGDWDALADRIAATLPELEASEVALLLATLAEAIRVAPARSRVELVALAGETLAQLGRLWDAAPAVPVGLLAAWLSLADDLREAPPLPERALVRAWIDLVPDMRLDVRAGGEVAALDDWVTLTDLLGVVAPETLHRLGFPGRQTDALRAIVARARTAAPELPAPTRALVRRALVRIGRLVPELGREAREAVAELVDGDAAAPPPEREPHGLELGLPLSSTGAEREIVSRVLRDL
jgi:hypothetical protein